MTRLVPWHSPPLLGGPTEYALPATLAAVLDEILAAVPESRGDAWVTDTATAMTQVRTLLELYEGRLARVRARDARLAADDGPRPAPADRHDELRAREDAITRWLRREVAWAALHVDLGACDAEHIAIAAGLALNEVQRLIEEEDLRP